MIVNEQIIECFFPFNKSARLPCFPDISARLQYMTSADDLNFLFRLDAHNILNRSDNFIPAQYAIDYTRNDFYAGRYTGMFYRPPY